MDNQKSITILAIESSCDETACAVVKKNTDEELATIIASTTATSLAKHKPTKGIVPEIAAREQLKCVLPVIEETLEEARISIEEIDAIAVTVGPGLVGSLLVGIETARALAYAWNKPLIPVNHIQAHPYANFANTDNKNAVPQFPALSWVISGGHTELYLMRSHQEIIKLGGKIDDAAGECFDKCARVLGFDYPGGPFIEKLAVLAQGTNLHSITLPRPMMHDKNFNTSFSGLKTAFFRSFKANSDSFDPEELKQILAYELQEAVTDIIAKKTLLALEEYPEVQSIIVSGGVAANLRLKEKLESVAQSRQITLHFPPLSLCTDNAAMIGAYATFHTDKKTSWEQVAVQLH